MIEPPVQEEPAAPPEPPPQAAQAPTPAPAAPETNYKQIWNGMLDRAKKELPNIYSMMSEGKFGGSKEGVYLLRFPADKQFYISFLMAEARRAQVEAILSELSGQPARFEALTEDTAPAQKDARRVAEQDIQALSAVFGRQNIIVTGGEQQEQP